MFESLDLGELLKSVEGKTYAKNEVVTFTIKEVRENKNYGSVQVNCLEDNGDQYTFVFGSNTPSKKRNLIAFLSTFFTREQLLNKSTSPVELVGQRFEAKSDGQIEYNGKNYQRWTDKFRKIETVASAEEFTA
jgi:hypothetical protein